MKYQISTSEYRGKSNFYSIERGRDSTKKVKSQRANIEEKAIFTLLSEAEIQQEKLNLNE